MTDVGFVVAAYAAVFIGLGAYVASVWGRTRRARAASHRIRRDARVGSSPVAAADPQPTDERR